MSENDRIYELAVEAGVLVPGVTQVSPSLKSLAKFAELVSGESREAQPRPCLTAEQWRKIIMPEVEAWRNDTDSQDAFVDFCAKLLAKYDRESRAQKAHEVYMR